MNVDRVALLSALDSCQDHGQALDVVRSDRLGLRPLPDAAEKVMNQARVAAHFVAGVGRNLYILNGIGIAGWLLHLLCAEAITTVPGGRPDLTGKTPIALPRGGQAIGAPAATVRIDDAVGHLKGRYRRCSMIEPGAGGIPLLAVDRDRIDPHQETRGIKRMDCHIEQEYVLHMIPKTTKVGADIKVTVDRGERTQRL